jgi:putative tributyrin esterase
MRLVLLACLALVCSGDFFRLKAEATPVESPGFRLQAEGKRLREETVHSPALGRVMKYRVLLPQGYETSQRRYPVLYLLHGLTGDYTDWTSRTNLAEYTRTLPLIVVMPDGANSWYTNAADGSAKFEDYIVIDLPADVVRKYRTVNSRYGRAIAGLSMGGYGALKLALKRPAAFAVAGSFSGAFGVTVEGRYDRMIESTKATPLTSIFGAIDSDTRKQNDVLALAAGLKAPGAPYLYIDCGTSDTLIAENRDVVAAIHKTGAAYEYHEIAGGHSWDYWDRRIREFLAVLMKKLAN